MNKQNELTEFRINSLRNDNGTNSRSILEGTNILYLLCMEKESFSSKWFGQQRRILKIEGKNKKFFAKLFTSETKKQIWAGFSWAIYHSVRYITSVRAWNFRHKLKSEICAGIRLVLLVSLQTLNNWNWLTKFLTIYGLINYQIIVLYNLYKSLFKAES